MKLFALTALACLLTIPAGRTVAQAPENSQLNLTGLWQINEAKSDDLAAIMRQAMRAGRSVAEVPGGGSVRGGGMAGRKGGRGGPGQDRQGPGNQNSKEAQKRVEQFKLQFSRLEIFQEGVEFNVTNGLDITQLIYTDGRLMTIWTQHGEAKATAVWKNQALVVEWRTSQAAAPRVRQYRISEDGLTLTVTEDHQLPGQDKATTIKQVYDRLS